MSEETKQENFYEDLELEYECNKKPLKITDYLIPLSLWAFISYALVAVIMNNYYINQFQGSALNELCKEVQNDNPDTDIRNIKDCFSTVAEKSHSIDWLYVSHLKEQEVLNFKRKRVSIKSDGLSRLMQIPLNLGNEHKIIVVRVNKAPSNGIYIFNFNAASKSSRLIYKLNSDS